MIEKLQNFDDSGQGNQGSSKKTMSSREIAELTGKMHKHVLTDCSNLNKHYQDLGMDEIPSVNYKADNGQEYRCYELTRMQCMDLMTGHSVPLRIKVNRRWEELEKSKMSIEDLVNDPKKTLTAISALLQKIEQEQEQKILAYEKLEVANKTIQDQGPKVLFANSVAVSKTTILVGELAKIIKQNGVDIGQNRLFEWLRKNGYLISRNGTDFNMPTQKSMDIGLFEIKETSITYSDGHVSINKTPKVTGKGQQYFINKFLNKESA